jgi:hypothetical protein
MLRKRSVLLHLLLHTGMGTKSGDFVQRGKAFGTSDVGAIAFGALSGGVGAELTGGNNWAYGAKTITHTGLGAGTGTVGMIAFGTVAGGAGAALTGGNFWQGAVTGLVVSGLNHKFHQQSDPNEELARRIAKQYGGNAGEIREWLNNHPFELVKEVVLDLKG